MKTTIFLFLFFFMGMAVAPTFAQEKANNAFQGWVETYAASGVWCDGDMIDLLTGEVRLHYVWRGFKNGSLIEREIDQFKGELTSTNTGEVFKFSRVMKWELTDYWTGITHYNLKGNMGNHYIAKIITDYSSGSPVFTIVHAVCH
ncbi:MAG: hypothetical protein K0B11_14000 [Mariniphaga sp.]|nr:hypothetical protein [Mariniphaga sp.]